jgi:hypothetical protein
MNRASGGGAGCAFADHSVEKVGDSLEALTFVVRPRPASLGIVASVE